MGARKPIRVGVIGLGLMGRTHLAAYHAAGKRCEVVAVCDRDPTRAFRPAKHSGNVGSATGKPLVDRRRVRAVADPGELLGDASVELVSICTPTDSHADLAVRALEAGKHVLCEKPVATDARVVRRVADAAARAKRWCMPAMCMRFWPGWSWLKQAIDERDFGRVRSAVFRRLGSPPAWSRGFYGDRTRSGGALFDLHVHDADLVRWLFGPPLSVQSSGTPDHLSTLYRFDTPGPLHVAAEAGWDHDAAFPFRMAYTVVFERATADFDNSRDPPLRLFRDGAEQAVELPDGTGYDGEVRHLLSAIGREARHGGLLVTCDDAEAVTRLLAAEERSQRSGLPVEV